jgi:HK97 family phage major capsid protein
MIEVKADGLEASFEALERETSEVAALKEEVALLRERVGQAVSRPALSGAKAEGSAFTERYLRNGIEAGVELKAMTGTTDAAGGYAVPEEIYAAIERTLTAISPIRTIANVVKVGSAGYRKLVTSGGTPSGWVSETAARPETQTSVFNESRRRSANSTPIRRQAKRCWTMPRSTWRAGSRRRSRPSSRGRKGRRSWEVRA